MAKNTGKQSRIGAVRGRSQVLNTRTGVWTKRDDGTGRFMSGKANGGSYKGVRHEKSR